MATLPWAGTRVPPLAAIDIRPPPAADAAIDIRKFGKFEDGIRPAVGGRV